MINILCDTFHKNLLANKNVLSYIQDRGISIETIKKFKLGYSCNGIAYDAVSPHFSDEEMLNSNWFAEKNGDIFDLFYNNGDRA